ncbi:hypothetical protein ACLBO4_29765, partial [Klebsiella pneumoniae]
MNTVKKLPLAMAVVAALCPISVGHGQIVTLKRGGRRQDDI